MIFSHRTALQTLVKVGLSAEVFLSPQGAMRGASLEKMLEKMPRAEENKGEVLGDQKGPWDGTGEDKQEATVS